ncbi:GNAT family N-acetyltransferase [Nocardioides sp. JQ2195]|uniref:GNAT family N-acetyltransferase n=1 Tax=Nocardioides sp. JQ2195 TaxID=2592334 RepID=UPI00143E8E89|nr:GNAT family protein [Nocardioides sp. JQ2195]QIX26089.1 GNAT family N-acetyltransferase [Nocardioides sp. JQ2195]
MSVVVPADPVAISCDELILREFRPGDAVDLEVVLADVAIATWNPIAHGDPAEFIAGRNDWSEGTHLSWAIADPSQRLVGSVSLFKVDPDQADAEIGYWVAPWGRGQGYAGRAVRAASAFAFDQVGLHRINLYHAVENESSCGVAGAAGFALEGRLRQSFRYGDGLRHDEHLHARLSTDACE